MFFRSLIRISWGQSKCLGRRRGSRPSEKSQVFWTPMRRLSWKRETRRPEWNLRYIGQMLVAYPRGIVAVEWQVKTTEDSACGDRLEEWNSTVSAHDENGFIFKCPQGYMPPGAENAEIFVRLRAKNRIRASRQGLKMGPASIWLLSGYSGVLREHRWRREHSMLPHRSKI